MTGTLKGSNTENGGDIGELSRADELVSVATLPGVVTICKQTNLFAITNHSSASDTFSQ